MTHGNHGPWWRGESFKSGVALAVIGSVLTIISGIVLGWFSSGDPGTGSSAPPPAASAPATASTAPPPEVGPQPSSPASSSGPASQKAEPASVFLSDLEALDGPLVDESQIVNGQQYPHSTGRPVYGNCSGRIKPEEIEYPIDRSWRRFTATVGLGNKSSAGVDVLFEVYLDGRLAEPGYTVNLASDRKIDVDVSQAVRLTLRMINTRGGEDSCWVGEGIWGDAKLTQ
ncbi:NPCBM/NEW2 domain-containing protein [Kitasatospora sp. NPDC051914]|uniref:NPCBM/NEW2 domain-containing protein n=1 Tax=Kitasatospora sp. NPDC051914 TaxID=3154945 RepID=UPI0034121ADE